MQEIEPTESYLEQAGKLDCAASLLDKIEATIRERPTDGTRIVSLKEDVEGLPMCGFFVRHWAIYDDGQKREVSTLHLYLSEDFPVYLWDMTDVVYFEAEWNSPDRQALLRLMGIMTYVALLMVRS